MQSSKCLRGWMNSKFTCSTGVRSLHVRGQWSTLTEKKKKVKIKLPQFDQK